jgi:hypothetical protein
MVRQGEGEDFHAEAQRARGHLGAVQVEFAAQVGKCFGQRLSPAGRSICQTPAGRETVFVFLCAFRKAKKTA